MTEQYAGYIRTAYDLETRESSQQMRVAEGSKEEVSKRLAETAQELGDGAETRMARVYRMKLGEQSLPETVVILPRPIFVEGYEAPRIEITARRVPPRTI